MNYEISNLTDNEHKLITEMLNSIDQIKNILSSMTKSERVGSNTQREQTKVCKDGNHKYVFRIAVL